jgi:glycosyltransferase involved in cell wall biosynthesis
MVQAVSHIGRWHIIPNGVDIGTYAFQSEVEIDAPLVFLGRIEEIKGPHIAIEIARRTGRRLVIAGNIPEGKKGWFESQVLPYVDGKKITYLGPVDDAQKNDLLGKASALLMPILWEEPFGIVMAEALACGRATSEAISTV